MQIKISCISANTLTFFLLSVLFISSTAVQSNSITISMPARYFNPAITLSSNIPVSERQPILTKLNNAIELLNNPPYAPLSAAQRRLINYVTEIRVVDGQGSGSGTGEDGIYFYHKSQIMPNPSNLGFPNINWIASTIAHEGTHVSRSLEGGYCMTYGEEAEKAGIDAQLAIAQSIGLSKEDYNYLNRSLSEPISYHKRQFSPGTPVLVREEKFEIESFHNYIDTEIPVFKGDLVLICGEGEFSFGPIAGRGGPDGIRKLDYQTDYFCFNKNILHGALIFRVCPYPYDCIENAGWHLAGVAKNAQAWEFPGNGNLEIAVNDKDWSNNIGSFKIRVLIFRVIVSR